MRHVPWQVVALMVLLARSAFSCADAEDRPGRPEERLRQAVLKAKTSEEAGKAYRALFKALDREGLLALENDPDVGIALQAAWELHVERALARKSTPHAERFLGFLEGRTSLRVPLRWEIDLVTEPRHPPGGVAAIMEDYLPIAPFLTRRDGVYSEKTYPFIETGLGFSVLAGTRLKKTDAGIALTVGEATITVEEKLVRQLKKDHPTEFPTLVAAPAPKRSYLAWYENTGHAFPVLCLDSDSGKVLWKAMAWGAGTENRVGFFSGQVGQLASISVAEGKVVVFGHALGGGCYLDAFSTETGASLFRFSSRCWCIHDGP